MNFICARTLNIVISGFLLCLTGSLLQAQEDEETPRLRDQEYLERAEKASCHLYSLDYEEAFSAFRELRNDFPRHPGPPLHLAVVLWQKEMFRRGDLKLDHFLTVTHFTEESDFKMPDQQRHSFFENLERSKKISRDLLEQEPGNLDARFFLGSALGIEASFEITVRHDKVAAFKKGKRSFEIHREIIKEDPDYYSAYLTVGMYEYITDNLPWYVKWLAVLAGYSGDEEKGFDYLRRAAENSTFSDDNARILLMVLYVREERYSDALRLAETLHTSYPRNPLFHVNQPQIHELMGNHEKAAAIYREILTKLENETPNYPALPEGEVRYQLGRQLFETSSYQEAAEQFRKVLELGASQRLLAFANLFLGKISDLQGERQKAREYYEQVLRFEEVDKSHAQARDLLDEPFQGR